MQHCSKWRFPKLDYCQTLAEDLRTKTHMFNFKDCRFKVEGYKLGTGRIVCWKQFNITHSFTLENSFYGYDFGEEESREFSEDDYSTVGIKLCDAIFEMHCVWKEI